MPSIEITRFSNFIHRKKERYPASKNGIFFVSKGSLSFTQPAGIDGCLNAGEFSLYNSGEIQNVEIELDDGQFSALSIDFDLSIFQEYRNQFDDIEIPRAPSQYIKFDRSHTDICTLKDLIVTLVESGSENNFALSQLAMSLLSLIVEKEPSLLATVAKAAQLSATQKVIYYIESNIENDISLESLAIHMGMSTATLKRRLASENLSFSSLLKVKRINHAATQLRTTNKSITQIAYESGFKSAAHFSTAFKGLQGLTPKEFRSRIAEYSFK